MLLGATSFSGIVCDAVTISDFVVNGNRSSSLPLVRALGALTLKNLTLNAYMGALESDKGALFAAEALTIDSLTTALDASGFVVLQANGDVTLRDGALRGGKLALQCDGKACAVSVEETLVRRDAWLTASGAQLFVRHATFEDGARVGSTLSDAMTLEDSTLGSLFGNFDARAYALRSSRVGCSLTRTPLFALPADASVPPSAVVVGDDVVHPSNCSLQCPCANCYAPYDGLVGCFRCAAGQVARDDFFGCALCPAGAYVQLGKCSPCGLGYVSQPDRLTCRQCASAESNAARTECVPCASGTYELVDAAGTALSCEPCALRSFKQFLVGNCSFNSSTGAVLIGSTLGALLLLVLVVVLIVVRRARAKKQISRYEKLLENTDNGANNNDALADNSNNDNFFDDATASSLVNAVGAGLEDEER